MKKLTSPIRVAVVGTGYFGRFHYDAWSRIPQIKLVGICSKSVEQAQPLAKKYGHGNNPLPVFTDVDALIQECQPDIIDITAPPKAHLELIERAAPKVSAISCQKPFCDGLAGAQTAIDVCARSKTRLAVHENFRFQPWYREIKNILDQGDLGDLFQATFRMRTGDGQGPKAYLDRQPYFQNMQRFLIHETGVHWIDTFRYLFGEPIDVYAQLNQLNPVISGEDAGLVLFDFENGFRGIFDGNRLSDHIAKDRRKTLGELTIEGSKGTIRLDGDGRIFKRKFGSNEEVEHSYSWHDHLFAGDCVYNCTRHIVDAWITDKTPETEANNYLKNQIIEELVYKSAKNGKRLKL